MGSDEFLPLFETRRAKGRVLYKLLMVSVSVAICLIWIHRVSHIPRKGEDGRWGWIGLLGAELWFGLYWLLTQAHRWNPVYRCTFKDRLSQRFVCPSPLSPSHQWICTWYKFIFVHICTKKVYFMYLLVEDELISYVPIHFVKFLLTLMACLDWGGGRESRVELPEIKYTLV